MDFATDTETGERIARLREKARETQTALGSLLGVGQPAVSRIERGERGLTGRELAVLAAHYGVPNAALVAKDDTLVLLRDADAAPEETQRAIRTFHEYVDFHFGVQALSR